jgi:hypothetical protein
MITYFIFWLGFGERVEVSFEVLLRRGFIWPVLIRFKVAQEFLT